MLPYIFLGSLCSNSSAFRSRFIFSMHSDSLQTYPVIMCFICLCRWLFDRKFPSTPENGSRKYPLWFSDGVLAKWNWLKGQKTLLLQCLNCSIKVVVWQMCANLFKGLVWIFKNCSVFQISFLMFLNERERFSDYRYKLVSPLTLVSISCNSVGNEAPLDWVKVGLRFIVFNLFSKFWLWVVQNSCFGTNIFVSITS